MKNLAHSASFESLDKDAPSNAGTKHLAYDAGVSRIEDRPQAAEADARTVKAAETNRAAVFCSTL
jgi:hypothetical protein